MHRLEVGIPVVDPEYSPQLIVEFGNELPNSTHIRRQIFELLPYNKTLKRKATTKSKFYFFDIGVANHLAQKLPLKENHSDMGDAFEHFIIQEMRAYLAYHRRSEKMTYWRTRGFEVDLIVGNRLAVEIKFSKQIKDDHLRGLRALREEKQIQKFIVVGRFDQPGFHDGIESLPFRDFLKKLWNGGLV